MANQGKKLQVGILLAVLLLIGCGGHTTSLAGKRSGLPEVAVIVDLAKPPGTSQVISRGQLQTEVETRLRQAGIKVVTYLPAKGQPAMPLMYVNVKIARLDEQFAYNVDILCMAPSRGLALPPRLANANLATSGLVPEIGQVREKVADLVNLFIKDYVLAQGGAQIRGAST